MSRARWTNWAGDQGCAPARLDVAAGEGDVAAAVERARHAGAPLRVSASGHSFTDIACTYGHMLRLDRMDRLLEVDAEAGRVRVEAGMTLHALGRRLAERGLGLENLGDIDRQTVGGAIATATHGTGLRFGNLSSQVEAIRMVAADGSVVECSPHRDPETFRAARVGLGALGVIVSVTLRVVPRFTLHRVDEPRPLRPTLAQLEKLARAHDHFELYAFPYTDRALTRTTERGRREPEPPGRAALWVQEALLENRAFDLVCRIGQQVPRAIPRLNRMVSAALGRSERIDHGHRVFASRREVRFTEMEYAVPLAAGAEAAGRVLALVQRRRLAVGFPIEVRCVAADDALLSPSHARDSCYVAVHMYRGMPFETYFRGVEAIMDEYGGRPHWGKRHYQSAATLRERYPEWDRFAQVRDRLDPEGRFANEYTDRVLGPARAGPLHRKVWPSPR